ncbi:hypothetical protein DTL42_19425 [Bremerella cremea]|uniref:Uncharacterized protein n=1 Tax=Bremerella cremea TaxID=1031537 RepID=A0A368KM70_9BACT|nr:hypothetical protein [Bremerella cremea]RCS42311.1 hypothetical protein DTL42_19425 [Bremerella cremea]
MDIVIAFGSEPPANQKHRLTVKTSDAEKIFETDASTLAATLPPNPISLHISSGYQLPEVDRDAWRSQQAGD